MFAQPDIAWSRQLSGTSPGQVALWTLAGVAVLALHAAIVWWGLQRPAQAAADDGPPPAVMIELAPVPVAPEPEAVEQFTEETVDSTPVETPEPVVEPEPVPEPIPEPEPVIEPEPEPVVEPEPAPEPEPVEEVIEPEPVDPIEEMVATELEQVDVPLPMARPEPPRPEEPAKPRAVEKPRVDEKPKEVAREVKRRPPPPSRAAARAQVDTQRADRAAASQTSRSQAASVSPARWQARLAAHLERRKRYPAEARRARQQGTAYVRFSIDTSGNVGSVSLSQSSGYPALDQEVLSLVRRASPVPAPPPGVGRTIVVPIRFNMR